MIVLRTLFAKPVRLQGKFEQFLPNKQDYKEADLEPIAIPAVAKRLAELHGATVSGVDHNKHKANMWANTYLIEYHIRSLVSFMNEGNDSTRKELQAQIPTERIIFEIQHDWFLLNSASETAKSLIRCLVRTFRASFICMAII